MVKASWMHIAGVEDYQVALAHVPPRLPAAGLILNEKHYASPSRRTHTRNSIRRNGCHIGV
jgi:hypothetical protein